jgi:hypothetical protein
MSRQVHFPSDPINELDRVNHPTQAGELIASPEGGGDGRGSSHGFAHGSLRAKMPLFR